MSDTTTSPLSQASQTEPALSPMSLADALARLDPKNDADWTSDGKPRIDALSALTNTNVTRADVDALAPDFNRDTASESPETGGEQAGIGEGVSGQPPADNDHVAEGAEQFPVAAAVAPEKSKQLIAGERDAAAARDGLSVEERLTRAEDDIAFLRQTYGWPTKA